MRVMSINNLSSKRKLEFSGEMIREASQQHLGDKAVFPHLIKRKTQLNIKPSPRMQLESSLRRNTLNYNF